MYFNFGKIKHNNILPENFTICTKDLLMFDNHLWFTPHAYFHATLALRKIKQARLQQRSRIDVGSPIEDALVEAF
jgi:hypothetical protein